MQYPQELKRSRLKKRKITIPRWVGYTGAVIVLCMIGFGTVYAMQLTNPASSPNETTTKAINHTYKTAYNSLLKTPTEQGKQLKQSSSPTSKSAPNTNDSNQQAETQQPNQSTGSKSTTSTSSSTSKQQQSTSQSNTTSSSSQPIAPSQSTTEQSDSTETTAPSTSSPETVQPIGPVTQIVNHVTNTVYYLLSGKTMETESP